jgi:prepilin-type N-terminal cleavage/methylation domain-containing protein
MSRRSFTLIELLSVVTIIAVLVVAVIAFIPSYLNWTRQSTDNRTFAAHIAFVDDIKASCKQFPLLKMEFLRSTEMAACIR